MRVIVVVIYLLTCCVTYGYGYPVKNKYPLVEEKKELIRAQRELSKQQAYVKQLEESIARKEIERIRKEIAQVDKQEVTQTTITHEQWLTFFSQQREVLGEIIRTHDALRIDAQRVLDEILTLITKLSDATTLD